MVSEQEYRAADGLNYSELSRFSQAPDYCLMEQIWQPYFETGHQFEIMLQDTVTGESNFYDKYFQAGVSGDVPDKVMRCLKNGDDLRQLETLAKSGERSKTQKNTHYYMDFCLKNPGKMPVTLQTITMLVDMVGNMLKMNLRGRNVGDLLSSAKWQVPMFWESNGIKKKALADIIIETSEMVFLIDAKTTADLSRFQYMMRDKYWIQDIHYSEGVKAVYGKPCSSMIFLASEKKEPYLAQAFTIDDESRERKTADYLDLCELYRGWSDHGKPSVGWIPEKEIRVY